MTNNFLSQHIQRFEVVQAKNLNDLISLTNLKTKNGWILLGGMVYIPTNFCPLEGVYYPFCQTIYRFEKKKQKKKV